MGLDLTFNSSTVNVGPIMWWPPWAVTEPCRARAFRGCDEWHNKSWAVVVPLLGAIVVFDLRYPRVKGKQHMYARYRGKWHGRIVDDCEICQQILADDE